MTQEIAVGSHWKYIGPTKTSFYTSGQIYTVRSEIRDDGTFVMDDNDNFGSEARHDWSIRSFMQKFVPAHTALSDLVAETQEAGPVRTETVTRKVIVPGHYERLRIEASTTGDPTGTVRLRLIDRNGHDHTGVAVLKPSELRALARTATLLAEALEDQS